MRKSIKYRIKSKPRKIKKIANVFTIIGTIIIVIGDWILGPIFRSLPFDMWIVFMAEILPIILSQIWIIGILLLLIGLYLLTFNWYKGTARISTVDESIYVSGKLPTFFDFKDLKEINIFLNDLMSRNSIRFDLFNDKVSLKFNNRNELTEFVEELIPIIKKYNSIKLNNWEY